MNNFSTPSTFEALVSPSEAKPSSRNAFWVLSVLAFLATAALPLYLYEYFQHPSWQLLVANGAMATLLLSALASAGLSRRGDSRWAIAWVLGTLLLSVLLTQMVIADLGPLLGLSAIVLPTLIAVQTLSERVATRVIFLSIGTGLALIAIEIYWPFPRIIGLEKLRLFGPLGLAGATLLYSLFIARNFSHYLLRTKLITVCLLLAVFSVGSITFATDYTLRKGFTAEVGSNLKRQAIARSLSVGDLLARQIDIIQTLSLDRFLRDKVKAANALYPTDLALLEQQLQALDQEWTANISPTTNLLIKDRLNNEVAAELKQFRTIFPDHLATLVTDKYGGIVGSSNLTTAYAQAKNDWWQKAWSAGHGDVFLAHPAFDQSTQNFVVLLAVPIYDPVTKEVVGIVSSSYRIEAVWEFLNATQFGVIGKADLLLPRGLLITSQKFNQTPMRPADPDELAQIKAMRGDFAQITFEQTPSFVGQAPVLATVGDGKKVVAALGWNLIAHQERAKTLRPILEIARTSLIMALLALSLAGVLAFWVAQVIADPIKRLTQTAQQITAGNLSQRINLPQQDEIGILAQSFNLMNASLQSRIVAEQLAQQESQRLQTAETQSRQNLEQTVAIYLEFVQQVAQGDLAQRLKIRSKDALGQLGQGLNGMVESLHSITTQVHQASANLAKAATGLQATTMNQVASASQQSAAISQISATVDQVKVITRQAAEQSNNIAQGSRLMLQNARQGAETVEETIDGMLQIRYRVESIARTILALSEQTQTIGAITATVSEIADQSNLLALNAAIEAASAGEQSRSFTVVAQQVRQLAERSKEATVQVQQILGEIQRITNAAVMVTEEGSKGVEAGVKLVTQAGEVIHQIETEVDRGAQANAQMASAAQHQTMSIDQIGQAMQAIRLATLQTLNSTRQAERTAKDLNTLAASLQAAIAAYRL